MAKLLSKPKRKKFDDLCDTSCPVRRSLDVLDGKWTILVLRDLLSGTKRFGQLRRSLGGVNPKTLTERLKQLEKADIVTRKIFAAVPPRVEYTLTQKGQSLKPVIAALGKWGSEWL
jgi:DNA-binding HxlR family transcriptional regulator